MSRLVEWLEKLGGARSMRLRSAGSWLALGLWWALLFGLAYATIGRATKFIYVDF
jgi:hypothetical protein